jgi:hypothetical protein
MDEQGWLAERFEAQRERLRAVPCQDARVAERGRRRRAGDLLAGQLR